MKNVELLRLVAHDLQAIAVEAVFFGGTVVGLHLDALPPGDEERPTTDVDCVPVAVETAGDMRSLETRLDGAGWRHDMASEKRNAFARIAPSGVPVDFVPLHTMDASDPVRMARRQRVELKRGLTVSVISSAGLVAAKLAAFFDRGRRDPLMSHDLEDLAMLLACCSTLERDVGLEHPDVKARVQSGLDSILNDRYILEILEGSFPRGVGVPQVLARMARLAGH